MSQLSHGQIKNKPFFGKRFLPNQRQLIDNIPILLFAALLLFLCVQAPYFLGWQNITTILRQTVPLAILCFGLVCVVTGGGDDVVSGGIDISLPAIAVLAAAIISDGLTNQGAGYLTIAIWAVGASLLAGAVNAVLVVWVRLPPLLATLASSVAFIGIANLITQQRRISVTDSAMVAFRDNRYWQLPVAVWFMLLILAVLLFVLYRTRWGLHLQASGGNREAAEMSGLPVKRLVVQSYMLAALTAVLAALALVARGSGSSPGTEESLLLEMVLATFIGSAFSRRRVVTIGGALLGALLVNALSNGLALLRVDIFWVGAIKGALILLVLATSALKSGGRY
ncbi:ABC transporter permease [Yersinia enterocolitica]|uniref:Membrane permease n=1 Tax=Yersinia enterocolitica TaxID=630 RepID=A0A9P1PXZ8_YEREN|nr:ABC transporter permease [Yersinia enterocolitica]EKN3565262.1 ABC transporter permease [Yersinia enterocolitica]EKN3849238.1 ABC transporter permease [Yersinia enterocolitica]EKN3968183.1 ABC transporter permease [Yersinia enterocolitica]EKN4019154.1 ABC transporter permease [Yersinia enterocolitica]EKN4194578.1 ABC transporter permease [Yersinia enterocolitica]